VVTLGAAIGLMLAVLSVTDLFLLRSSNGGAGEAYVYSARGDRLSGFPYHEYDALRTDRLFSGLAVMSEDGANLLVGTRLVAVRGQMVSSNYFSVLRETAKLGRVLDAAIDGGASPPTVVLSDHAWRSYYGRDPHIIGRHIRLHRMNLLGFYGVGREYLVVGVAREGFNGRSAPWEPIAYWVPIEHRLEEYAAAAPVTARAGYISSTPVVGIARIAPGVQVRQAAAALDALSVREQATGARPSRLVLRAARLTSLPFDPDRELVPARLAATLTVIAAAALVVVSVNVTLLLVARAHSRRASDCVQVSVGATPGAMLFQSVADSTLIACGAAGIGLLTSQALTSAFVQSVPVEYSQGFLNRLVSIELPITGRLLGLAVIVTVVSAALTSSVPAIFAMRTPIRGTRASDLGTVRRSGLTLALLTVQIALCVALAAFALAWFLRVGGNAWSGGFLPRGVIVANFALPRQARDHLNDSSSMRRSVNARLLSDSRQLQGVREAALTNALPTSGFQVDLITPATLGHPKAVLGAWVSDGFFSTLSIPLLQGRDFDVRRDRSEGARVAIVSRDLADAFWPGASPIGERIAVAPNDIDVVKWMEVIGVVGKVTPPGAGRPSPVVYEPLSQQSNALATSLILRGDVAASAVQEKLGRILSLTGSGAALTEVRTLSSLVDDRLFAARAMTGFLGLTTAFCLIVTTIGLCGAVWYSTQLRSREVAVRRALGATDRSLIWALMKDAAIMAVTGVALGSAVVPVAIRLSEVHVGAFDGRSGIALVAASILVLILVCSAAYLPAWRAIRGGIGDVLRGGDG
jgi:predicted permease